MRLQTPQRQSPNPKPYQNLQDFRSENKQERYNQQMGAANMEKFKEIVIKLANSLPNKPLSKAKNNFIRDRFDRLLSVLHTPDHPPYAWMIERALRELNENGGSSEASISNFIKKEYDLPWSHFTLLKHHLQALCECGSIVLTHGQRYLLGAADSTVNPSTKCKRKSTRKKRDWDWDINRRKRRKKDSGKESLLQKEDQVHERQNCLMEGLEQQKLEAKARIDMPQLCVVGEDGEQIEGGQTEIATPERPPGFDSTTFEGPSHLPVCCAESPSQCKHPIRGPTEVVVSAAESLPGHQEHNHVFNVSVQLNHEEQQMILSAHGTPERSVNQTLQDVQPITSNSIDSQKTKNEENPAMPSQTRPIELCSQKKLPESELPKNTAVISEAEPVNLTGGKRVTRIVFKYQKRPPVIKAAKENDLSCTIQEIKEEMLQQKQIKCLGKRHSDDNLLQAMDIEESLPTPRMQRQRKRWAKQPLNLKRPQPEHQAPMGSSQVTRKEVKFYSAEQLEVALTPSVASKQADSQKLSKLASLEMNPKVEPQTQVLKHHPEKQISEEKPSCRVLRPRPLKPEQSSALTASGISPSHDQQDMQQQPKYSCRGRPPKAKPDIRVSNDKVVSYPNPHLRQQSQEPKQKCRG